MTKTDLNKIATHYQLGELLETLNWDKKQARSSIWSDSIAVVVGLVLLASVFPVVQKEFLKVSLSMSIFLISLLSLIIIGIVFFAAQIRKQTRRLGNRAISVFEHGFVDERHPKAEVFLYQNIVEIWQHSVQVGGGGYFSSYSVTQKDGSKCYLNEKIEDVDQFGVWLQQVCLTYQLPPLIESFQAGENLEFGYFDQIALNQQGIIHNKKLFARTDLNRVELRRGFLNFSGQRFHHSIPTASITNLHVFFALVKQIKLSVLEDT